MDYEYQPEINIKIMLFYILRQWRLVLSTAIVCCALLGSYDILRTAADTQNDRAPKYIREYEIALMQYTLTKSTYEQNIKITQARLEQQIDYMNKSVLMQVDPYHKPTASGDIFIRIDETEWGNLPNNINLDPTDSLIKVYTSNFLSTIDWTPIEELTGQDAVYLKELLSISTDYNSNTFTVSVVYSDGNTAANILDLILNQIVARHESMDMDINKHSISALNKTLSYSIDNDLANTQKTNKDIITDYKMEILDCQEQLENLIAPTPPSVLTTSRYFLIGFAGGGFLAVLLVGVYYMTGERLHNETELKERYGYHWLGNVFISSHTGLLSAVDRFLDRLELPDSISEEEMYHMIAANIENLVQNHQKLLITGTINEKKLYTLTEALLPLLSHISLMASPDMNQTAETLQYIADCDAILLVEERHKSRLSDIQREQEYISAMNKPVIGYVLFS